uniref:G_PROTEIN_RECEP_F1_2 domain-containing protein n=1 Tax=Panagrellus redivivus TaxID=6233 RepID=A0A7E4UVX7_PANRE
MWSTSLKISVYGPLYISTIIEFTALSYLIYAMCLRKSPIQKAYFVISIVGYAIDFTANFSACIAYYSKFKHIVVWHDSFFLGISILTLAFNRFTTIAYWKDHNRLWSFKPACAWCVFVLAYPVLVDIGFLASDSNGFTCLPNPFLNEECGKIYGKIGIRQCISNGITSIGSITLNIMTIVKIRHTSAPQAATKLFIQSCVSNVLFAVYTISLTVHDYMRIYKDTTDLTLSNVLITIAK